MCDIDDDAGNPLLLRKQVATVDDRCSFCQVLISTGTQYIQDVLEDEGDDVAEPWCLSCAADREMFARAHDNIYPGSELLLACVDDCIDQAEDESEISKWVDLRESLLKRAKDVERELAKRWKEHQSEV